jgi:catechol 2,3-dioxygenase-like lactoylglutathione lyase family enzyme
MSTATVGSETKSTQTGSTAGHDVGGLRLERPFRIRRLGHFGVNLEDVAAGMPFYTDLLGFMVSDPINFNDRPGFSVAEVGPGTGYFMRHGTDHHSFVIFPARVVRARPGHDKWPHDVTINQITWQVGTLREVVEGGEWLRNKSIPIVRTGRDTPGSNWHAYPLAPGFHTNELYYGIEQVGWDGLSKPMSMHKIKYTEAPGLPHGPEYKEVEAAVNAGIDIRAGYKHVDPSEPRYDVGGVLLPRPFKIGRIGPVRLFENDVEESLRFYRDLLGLTVTEEIRWNGHRCVFLRAGTEHHSLALYPKALRAELGLSPHTTLMSFGVQVGDYSQLRNAVQFLKQKDVTIKYLPPELFPGIDYSAFALDPEGHAIQLYYYMEQIGWDGRPRPAEQRRKVSNDRWPESLEPLGDTFTGEQFLGPLG